MTTVSQPTAMPTNKLTASMLGMVMGAFVFEFAASYFPGLRDVTIDGYGSLSTVFQIIFGFLAGYMVKDQPNVVAE